MANTAQRSFSSGELSPAMYARTDLQRYAIGLRTLRNATVLRTGGVQNRAGFQYLGATKYNTATRLVDAVFDTNASYVLEFGVQYVRFWKNGALVRVPTPAAWVTATAYATGTVRSHNGTNYVCTQAHTSGSSTEPGIGASWGDYWYTLDGDIYEWPTPYTSAQLNDLQFAYQLDVVTIVHPAHPPATLTRTIDYDWTLANISFSQTQNAVANIAVSGSAGSGWGYTVSALFGTGYNIAVGPAVAIVRTNSTQPQITAYNTEVSTTPRTVTWNAVPDATGYLIHLNRAAGELLYVQQVGAVTTFNDGGSWSSTSTSSYSSYQERLAAAAPFGTAGEYPAVVGAYQQRLLLSGTTNNPDVVRASAATQPYDFFSSDPITDSDPVEWRQIGRRLNRLRHFVEVAQRLFQFSDIGEAVIQGSPDGVLRPGEVNPRQFSENGAAAYPSPLIVNDTALYVQARGAVVRDLAPSQFEGFTGSDLTLQAAHLVDGLRIVAWCYQQTPDSVVWAVRDDGALLSLTYVRELGILGWAKHDTDGLVKSVCCIPENNRDAVYAVVRRTINGFPEQYVERLENRLATSPVLMDSAVSIESNDVFPLDVVASDGSVSGGRDSTITLTFNTTSPFMCPVVGDQILLTYSGDSATWTVTDTLGPGLTLESSESDAQTLANACTSPTEITLPAYSGWSRVGDWTGIGGLSHLAGKAVSVVNAGYLLASPNNPAYSTVTVNANGIADVGVGIAATASVGLPYTTDIQTLDIDSVGTTVKDRGMQVGGLIAWVENTGKFYAGPKVPTGNTLTGLEAFVPTDDEGYSIMDNYIETVTGVAEVTLQATYNNTGRVLIRQVDPVPLTILSIAPTGFLNGGR